MTRLMWSGKKNKQDRPRKRKLIKKKTKKPDLKYDGHGRIIGIDEE